jgi:pyridoxamine 5'-phosphate oxidase
MSAPPHITETELVRRVWTELQRATVDRHHEWRTPVLATVDPQGVPQARTVVLRSADAGSGQLVFFTDSRSPKVAELQANPAAALVFWSRRLQWQLRVGVRAVVQTEGPQVDAAWARVSQSAAAGDYLSSQAPGSALQPATATVSEQHHLAVIAAQVEELDWLELSREGHRRARVLGSEVQWLVP